MATKSTKSTENINTESPIEDSLVKKELVKLSEILESIINIGIKLDNINSIYSSIDNIDKKLGNIDKKLGNIDGMLGYLEQDCKKHYYNYSDDD